MDDTPLRVAKAEAARRLQEAFARERENRPSMRERFKAEVFTGVFPGWSMVPPQATIAMCAAMQGLNERRMRRYPEVIVRMQRRYEEMLKVGPRTPELPHDHPDAPDPGSRQPVSCLVEATPQTGCLYLRRGA